MTPLTTLSGKVLTCNHDPTWRFLAWATTDQIVVVDTSKLPHHGRSDEDLSRFFGDGSRGIFQTAKNPAPVEEGQDLVLALSAEGRWVVLTEREPSQPWSWKIYYQDYEPLYVGQGVDLGERVLVGNQKFAVSGSRISRFERFRSIFYGRELVRHLRWSGKNRTLGLFGIDGKEQIPSSPAGKSSEVVDVHPYGLGRVVAEPEGKFRLLNRSGNDCGYYFRESWGEPFCWTRLGGRIITNGWSVVTETPHGENYRFERRLSAPPGSHRMEDAWGRVWSIDDRNRICVQTVRNRGTWR